MDKLERDPLDSSVHSRTPLRARNLRFLGTFGFFNETCTREQLHLIVCDINGTDTPHTTHHTNLHTPHPHHKVLKNPWLKTNGDKDTTEKTKN